MFCPLYGELTLARHTSNSVNKCILCKTKGVLYTGDAEGKYGYEGSLQNLQNLGLFLQNFLEIR